MSRPHAEQAARFKAVEARRRAAAPAPEEPQRRPQHVGASTPWGWNESNPLYKDHIRNQNRKPPVPRTSTPQGDIYRDDQNWSALDKAIDEATAEAHELLKVLGEVLDREAILASAERERTNEMAQKLPALGGDR